MNPGETPKPKFKNKRERNEGYVTAAMQVFKDRKLLNERPPDMPIDVYKFLRKEQTLILKNLFHKGKSPSRKLNGITGNKEPLARTAKGIRKIIKQRKAS